MPTIKYMMAKPTGNCQNPECNKPLKEGLYCCVKCGNRARYMLRYGVGRSRHGRRERNDATPRAKRHIRTHAGYMAGCLKCRNARRWAEFKKHSSPILCKSGRVVPQASIPGRR